ncbi:MAG: 30S ribosomal protein S12 methylthiotransferase RimO [Bacteroidales bacterium]|nr:30S ribosomal protein S12 methylthiotransferase RimO [Bacteroidales bacterium]MDY6406895.1 30S ribosomal protein S12 methylthiotransferase RimO [Bacteroidales bacterium]
MRKGEIDFITLGCSKNLVDAERVMRQLEVAGWKCVHDAEDPKGEVCVINTCGFIGDAKEESIHMILQMAERKKKGKLKKLIVMGCLSERYRAELEEELPEVDEYFGKFDFENLTLSLSKGEGKEAGYHPAQLTKYKNDGCAPYERKLTTPKHYAYLKISEGCNRMCSYCAIPLITGRHTSRPKEEILDEVRWLVSQGVKEFNVIAQDLSSYGLDLKTPPPTLPSREGEKAKGEGLEAKGEGLEAKGRHMLPELVDEMAQIEGVDWIRLHYAYPTDFPEALLDVMARHANVCKYLDIALQHCTDHMLGLMRRHITRAGQDALIRKIREKVPGICLRTTLLVGHPGETEEDFEELKEWVKEMRFDRMGCFAYSDEEGTYANKHYKDDIPQEVKEKRVEELMAIQQTISGELMQGFVGKTEKVVVDRKEGEFWIGRTQFDSPEVDCEVLIENIGNRSLEIGDFYDIKITSAEEFDLYGEI